MKLLILALTLLSITVYILFMCFIIKKQNRSKINKDIEHIIKFMQGSNTHKG